MYNLNNWQEGLCAKKLRTWRPNTSKAKLKEIFADLQVNTFEKKILDA